MSEAEADVRAVPCCGPFGVKSLSVQEAAALAPAFKALGDPVRLRLVSLIAPVPEVCVCDLVEAFDLTASTISHHLKVLRDAGVVESERRGTWVYYRLRPLILAQLAQVMSVG